LIAYGEHRFTLGLAPSAFQADVFFRAPGLKSAAGAS
jgi:hypothetical protein